MDVLRIDNTSVRESQIRGIQQTKAARDPVALASALQALTAAAGNTANAHDTSSVSGMETNLLRLAVEAARCRATLGEISSALESVWGRHVASTQVVQGAYNASFNRTTANAAAKTASNGEVIEDEYAAVLSDVKAFAEREGRRPRMLVAKMGQDGHDRGAKVIASGFSDLGYDVDVGPLFSTPAEVAQQAIDADVVSNSRFL